MDLLNEFWRSVPSYAKYSISNFGRVKSFHRCRTGNILSAPPNSRGYRHATFCDNGKYEDLNISRLVALLFIGPPPTEKHEVNHKDGDKQNDCVENLEWVTSSENTRHAHRVLGVAQGWNFDHTGTNNPNAKTTLQQVCAIKALLNKNLLHRDIARELGVSIWVVSDISRGRNWRSV